MLFRPPTDQNLSAVRAMLDGWDGDADRFRQAAQGARTAGVAMSLTVSAAQDAHEALSSLLEELDDALQKVGGGSRLFLDLLHAQTKASALLESLCSTRDILDLYVTVQIGGPTSIAHGVFGSGSGDENVALATHPQTGPLIDELLRYAKTYKKVISAGKCTDVQVVALRTTCE